MTLMRGFESRNDCLATVVRAGDAPRWYYRCPIAPALGIGVASQKKTQNALPRFARSQGPLARPTQKDSVRIHTLSHL
jgi:hypothetical protein